MAHKDRHHDLFADNLHEVLAASANGALKGTSQWSTPVAVGSRLATPLGRHRPILCDLNCGPGALLQGAANETTETVLGLDISAAARPLRVRGSPGSFVAADLAVAYPLLVEAGFRAQCFVLNPPWDLHWHYPRFQAADAALHPGGLLPDRRDPRLAEGLVDSAVATWLVALDRSAPDGEGLLLLPARTFERLVAAPGAPFHDLLAHVWATLEFDHWLPPRPGHPAQRVICVWWQRRRTLSGAAGPTWVRSIGRFHPAAPIPDRYTSLLGTPLRDARLGTSAWRAVAEECARRREQRPEWNIWLSAGGHLQTHLTSFQRASIHIPKEEASALQTLHGRRPVDLVLRRAEREVLQAAVRNQRWAVAPAVAESVAAAVQRYHRERAPIIALPPTQRLGFLDEHDQLTCRETLTIPGPGGGWPITLYREGVSYRLTSATTPVLRRSARVNSAGEDEPVELAGSELVLRVTDELGRPVPFLDPRVLHPSVQLPKVEDRDIALDLHVLLAHFHIPEVPDLAAVQPEAAAHYRERLSMLETSLRNL